MNELKFIKYLTGKIKPSKDIVRGIGDDTAVIKYTKDKYLLFASDMIIGGVHFTKNADPFNVGWKAAAVNISDIAAMGGIPKYIVISVGVPGRGNEKILKGITEGAMAVCRKFGVEIAGGDTNFSKNIIIDVSIIGEVEKKNVVRRDGAKEGDLIFVTGKLGDGRNKHLTFTPRIKESRLLVENFKVNAMMDISDGLFLDLSRLCDESKVGSCIYKSLIPVSDKAKSLKDALTYGEDFELLFTMSISEAKKLMRYMGKKFFPDASLIGQITNKSKGINFIDEKLKMTKIKPLGYQHF